MSAWSPLSPSKNPTPTPRNAYSESLHSSTTWWTWGTSSKTKLHLAASFGASRGNHRRRHLIGLISRCNSWQRSLYRTSKLQSRPSNTRSSNSQFWKHIACSPCYGNAALSNCRLHFCLVHYHKVTRLYMPSFGSRDLPSCSYRCSSCWSQFSSYAPRIYSPVFRCHNYNSVPHHTIKCQWLYSSLSKWNR